MKIAVVGTGYVGLVSGACFSDMGMDVTCVDIDRAKIDNLNAGVIPIYEPGLEELVIKNKNAGRLRFTTDLVERINEYDAIFCAVGTPPGEDGGADLKHVLDVARTVGRHMNRYVVFVTKSTVPVGTGQKVREVIREELDKRGVAVDFDIASNPEFLKEGAAISDFMSPDRIVVGLENDRAKDIMDRIYKPFLLNNYRIIYTDIPSAEMIKYASNAMLATRISFMNDIANLCELTGADVDMVRKGIGTDTRIGNKFLYPGIGYGGSCFPKDVKALVRTAAENGYDMEVLRAVENVNGRQKSILFHKLDKHFEGELKGRTIALWGLSFKPETDDMREAPSLIIIEHLLEAGCVVNAYDPTATEEARKHLGDTVNYFEEKYAATEGADALMLLTEWKEFRVPDWERLHKIMKTPLVFDGRNIYDGQEVASKGFEYYRIGK
jgi:nucleotide sugar dehydrogenase